MHPQAAGVVRSLVGENSRLPTGVHHHVPSEHFVGQAWHSDGLSGSGCEINEIQRHYYPHDLAREDGPTIILSRSHCRAVDSTAIAHYNNIAGHIALTVTAGTIAATRYGIWHRAGPKFNHAPRSMIKFPTSAKRLPNATGQLIPTRLTSTRRIPSNPI